MTLTRVYIPAWLRHHDARWDYHHPMPTWSTRQLAKTAHLPEASVRRILHDHPAIKELPTDKATLALHAIRAGHNPQAIDLIAATPETPNGAILITINDNAMLMPNLQQAAAFLDSTVSKEKALHATITILPIKQ